MVTTSVPRDGSGGGIRRSAFPGRVVDPSLYLNQPLNLILSSARILEKIPRYLIVRPLHRYSTLAYPEIL